jgi:glycosyltransferase involved in cell wall biosynthesis
VNDNNISDILVSIITVTYNSEATVERTIKAVFNQTYHNIEYIVVDGLSNDGTIEIINSYKDQFKERGSVYKILSEKDNGIYEAMNKGIKLTTGQVVGMINSDDWYEPDAIEKVAKQYDKEPFELLYASIRCIRQDGISFIKKSKLSKNVTSRHWNHPTTFFARSVYDKRLYACENLYDDMDMYLWARRNLTKIIVLNDVLANFSSGGPSNSKNIRKVMARIKEKYRLYRKFGYSRLYLFEEILTQCGKLVLQ